MKQLAAILLLLLLTFNLAGYRLLFYYMQQQADSELSVSLDKATYNETDLITITLPLSLPYITDTKDFIRMDGEVSVNGIVYKYVKRKISHGQLVLLCLPDHHRTQLQSAKDNFFKCTNDLQQPATNKKSGNTDSSSLKNILSNYDKPTEPWTAEVLVIELTHHYSRYIYPYSNIARTILEQPPEGVKA